MELFKLLKSRAPGQQSCSLSLPLSFAFLFHGDVDLVFETGTFFSFYILSHITIYLEHKMGNQSMNSLYHFYWKSVFFNLPTTILMSLKHFSYIRFIILI